ncbi:hypothetical protein WOSG25_090210 [Weissella oryzae SG25]|uniref:Uncharacterized protein n=1 Tax=Weissella oryzae (strain DSM 25784 / JCM 18191 / LMG 30913 / SG25) TaxID=1329250 RepID=A0A069CV51_WEIOS|nr:hypothetical protein [Weissella oryzae]GAK31324.1 hypothetical protein WOSG25_090210 [Weissella oryzae SG25]
MGRFDKFKEAAGSNVEPISLDKKHVGRTNTKTKSAKVEAVPTKSIKIKARNYDQLGLLKVAGQGSYVELLDKAVTEFVDEFLTDNPEYQAMFSKIDNDLENPNQMSIEDFL